MEFEQYIRATESEPKERAEANGNRLSAQPTKYLVRI